MTLNLVNIVNLCSFPLFGDSGEVASEPES
jgi:hypothetical protein